MIFHSVKPEGAAVAQYENEAGNFVITVDHNDHWALFEMNGEDQIKNEWGTGMYGPQSIDELKDLVRNQLDLIIELEDGDDWK